MLTCTCARVENLVAVGRLHLLGDLSTVKFIFWARITIDGVLSPQDRLSSYGLYILLFTVQVLFFGTRDKSL